MFASLNRTSLRVAHRTNAPPENAHPSRWPGSARVRRTLMPAASSPFALCWRSGHRPAFCGMQWLSRLAFRSSAHEWALGFHQGSVPVHHSAFAMPYRAGRRVTSSLRSSVGKEWCCVRRQPACQRPETRTGMRPAHRLPLRTSFQVSDGFIQGDQCPRDCVRAGSALAQASPTRHLGSFLTSSIGRLTPWPAARLIGFGPLWVLHSIDQHRLENSIPLWKD